MSNCSNNMEVDCSLEEFARVLVANGYINDDSCFADADIPTIINAFETADMLVSPDSFPSSPYNNGDLSRIVEMAQIANRSLYESCLSESLAHPEVIPQDYNISRTHECCKVSPGLNASSQNLATSLSYRDNNCSNDIYLDNTVIKHPPVYLNFNISDTKTGTTMKDDNFQPNKHQLPHSTFSPPDNSICLQDFHYHNNNSSYHMHSSTNLQNQIVLHSNNSLGKDATTVHGCLHDPPQSLPSRTKQKRRRRNKGYSKPTKSKTKKMKTSEKVVQTQPKIMKEKVAKDIVKQERASKEERISSIDCADIVQDDSGFESEDKKICKEEGSLVNENLEMGSFNKNSESDITAEPNNALRRSSRSTRNTENYNFRLSSLVKRVETEKRQQEPRQAKDKTKPAPLSKYRRRTANARERDRMKEINDAFDNLKDSLPSIETEENKQKVTKFTILKHALNYIASLRDMLNYEPMLSSHDDDVSSDFSSIRPASVTSSGGDDSCSSPISNHSLLTPSSSNEISSFWISDRSTQHDQTQAAEMFPHPSLSSSTLQQTFPTSS